MSRKLLPEHELLALVTKALGSERKAIRVIALLDLSGLKVVRKRGHPPRADFYKQLVQEVLAGESCSSVAKRHGISSSGIYGWIHRLGIDLPRRRPSLRNRQILAAYQSGKVSMQDIAEEYGITRQRVQAILDRYDEQPTRRRSLKQRSRRFQKESYGPAIKELLSGATYAEVAAKYGFDLDTLYSYASGIVPARKRGRRPMPASSTTVLC